MKSFVAIASLAAVVTVAAIGPVDPKKLPLGWCKSYTDMSCADGAVPTACGANSTYTRSCNSTFSNDLVCTSFQVSCLCTPIGGGEQKDVSLEALNLTFEAFPSPKMCSNLVAGKNATGSGLVSGDYKPDGLKPNASATAPNTSATDKPSSGATIQMALSTFALAALSLGMAMI
ncbi:hypothetical protein BGX27_008322 [Mortierella sp. AM989]|nr:hypothetical protein BGX27_008322 [Mortierella sp. AM989]